MVTQWARQKAQWLFQRGLSWPWAALTRPHIRIPIFTGTSSISTKLFNSSWRARRETQSQRVKVFRPLLFRVTGPSTCRNGQCKHQTRLCTTVLWVTQWHRAAGELSTNPECRCGSGCGQPCTGVALSVLGVYASCAVVYLLSHVRLFFDPVTAVGSSVHGISQARRLEWVAISFSWKLFRPRNGTHVSCLSGRFFTTEPPESPCFMQEASSNNFQLWSSVPRTLQFLDWSIERNLGGTVKRGI